MPVRRAVGTRERRVHRYALDRPGRAVRRAARRTLRRARVHPRRAGAGSSGGVLRSVGRGNPHAGHPRGGHASRARRDRARLALPPAGARGHRRRRERQDDGQGDALGCARAGLRRGRAPGHAGQPEQRRRRSADAAAAAQAAPRGGDRAGHQPSRRDRLAGAGRAARRRAGEQRATRTPGVPRWHRRLCTRERRVDRRIVRRGRRGLSGRRSAGTAVASACRVAAADRIRPR